MHLLLVLLCAKEITRAQAVLHFPAKSITLNYEFLKSANVLMNFKQTEQYIKTKLCFLELNVYAWDSSVTNHYFNCHTVF